MKKLFLLSLAILFFGAIVADAKYKYPEGATTATERRINRRLKHYGQEDDEGEKYMTLDEYREYRTPKTVDERRHEQWAKRKGTYVFPEDAFNAMDKDGDGKITAEDMMEYEQGEQE